MIMIILFLSLFTSLTAPPHSELYIPKSEPINPFETIWKAVCKVESGGNIMAVGDKQLKDYSYGIAQIRMERLNDYYNKTGIRYFEKDMFDPNKAKQVYMYYAMQFNPSDIKSIVCEWNGGPHWKKIKSVEKYYLKIQKQMISL